MNDFSLWEEIKKTITPLSGKGVARLFHKEVPQRLRVRRIPAPELSYTLNLHGYTVADSYEMVKKFITRHQNLGSKKNHNYYGERIKTGRGHQKRNRFMV